MINTQKLIKVALAWTSTMYAVCYLGVWIFPGIREKFMLYALHAETESYGNVLTFGTFVSGLIIWNVVAVLATWFFAGLWNKIK